MSTPEVDPVGLEKPDRVAAGQVWRDNDPRTVHQEFEVVDVTTDEEGTDYALIKRGGRNMRIRCDRLLNISHSRGYTYLGRGK